MNWRGCSSPFWAGQAGSAADGAGEPAASAPLPPTAAPASLHAPSSSLCACSHCRALSARLTRPWSTAAQHQNLLGAPPIHPETACESSLRDMIRMLASADVTKRHRVVRRLLQLAAGEHPGGVAGEQQRYQHGRMIGSPTATPAISAGYSTELELVYNFHHKTRQMLLWKPWTPALEESLDRAPELSALTLRQLRGWPSSRRG